MIVSATTSEPSGAWGAKPPPIPAEMTRSYGGSYGEAASAVAVATAAAAGPAPPARTSTTGIRTDPGLGVNCAWVVISYPPVSSRTPAPANRPRPAATESASAATAVTTSTRMAGASRGARPPGPYRPPDHRVGQEFFFLNSKCQMPVSVLPLVSTMLTCVSLVVSPVWVEKKALPGMVR